MARIRSALIYMALVLVANPAFAGTEALEALREGTLKKLLFVADPQTVADIEFTDPDGGTHRLSDWRGKHILVNFWATWCAPCRAEMPALDALQAEFGGETFEVVTIATGRNVLAGLYRFFEETGVQNLPILLDPKQALARELGVFGLPTTLVVDAQGREIARLRGDAEWHSDSARAIVAAMIGVSAE